MKLLTDMNNGNKKRILIFSVAYLPFIGGAEVAVKELTDRLSDYDFDLVTVNLDGRQKSFEKIGAVNVYRVGSGKLGKYFFPIKGYLKARRLMQTRSYNLVWAIMANYAGLAALFFKKKFFQVPLVLTLQEGDPLPYIKKRMSVMLPLFRSLFKTADRVTAISNYLADWGVTMGATSPVAVVPNGVEVKKFQVPPVPEQGSIRGEASSKFQVGEKRKELGFGEDDVVLVTTSRLVPKNAVADIISSLDFLPENVKLLIVGSGPLFASFKLQVTSYKLEDRVVFADHVRPEKIPEYLWASDIFIRPSLSEGMGNSFIEAMAAGLPVIATPVGGIVDFLRDGETGLFCEVDNPRSIAQKVEKLIKDKESRDYIVENAKRLVAEKYDWSIVAKQMKSVFNQLIK